MAPPLPKKNWTRHWPLPKTVRVLRTPAGLEGKICWTKNDRCSFRSERV